MSSADGRVALGTERFGSVPVLVDNAAVLSFESADVHSTPPDARLRAPTDTIVWLAALPDRGPTGGFFRDRRASAW